MARHALDLTETLARAGVAASMENPEGSYLWGFLDFAPDLAYEDIRFTPCMFGAPYQKPTRLRCWNWRPTSLLNNRCKLVNDVFSCGRLRSEGHLVLEFGGGSTRKAATYVPGLCHSWVQDIRQHFVRALPVTPTRWLRCDPPPQVPCAATFSEGIRTCPLKPSVMKKIGPPRLDVGTPRVYATPVQACGRRWPPSVVSLPRLTEFIPTFGTSLDAAVTIPLEPRR